MSERLRFDGVGKTFPGVVALDGVSFTVGAGELRALIGENGAGKSTLLKILSGQYRPDTGTLAVDGKSCAFRQPRDAQDAGIAIIHQELQLVPDLSVAENLMLGTLPARGGWVDRAELHARAAGVLARLGEDIRPETRLGSLSIGQRQMVEIGRALLRDARIIAFDEPTSSLSARETERLMAIIGELRTDGAAILYVSHRMEEVYALADSATVLRDGRHIADVAPVGPEDADRLITAMAGRAIADIYAYRPRPHGDAALTIDGIVGPGLRAPVSLQVAEGEILGLFGLVGAGRSELFRLVYGAERPEEGQVLRGAMPLPPGDPRAAIAVGLGLCPEDRKDAALLALAPVRENIAIGWRNRHGAVPWLRPRAERNGAAAVIADMRVKTASAETPIGQLSGGNQQKAVIGRWLMADAGVLLLDEPTRGIDVGARSEIYDRLYRFTEAGGSVLFASSDMAEVLGVADRIAVMREGRLAAVIPREQANAETLLRLALPEPAPSNPVRDAMPA
ncbi:ATP-binding cassette domain-containing protein [Sphingomonas sp.]|uniref:ATP-binding cassette domain-containing protein n=1 Tax=Sphingomonas sp. TaxID=28214 RepID=UPI000DBC2262|nr:ATP-binding cassette domain-containing protein [Sphingomonas sp.]PZT94322.1 MAG: L-arabinose ABC transporter ATP-binding protein AraG [Sphingomonas sp.]